MELSPTEIQKLAIAKSKGKRPKYLDERSSDHLMSMILVLAEELSVTRERADTLERLLFEKNIISSDLIESFVPDQEAALERQIRASEFASRLVRSVRQEIDSLSNDQKTTEEMAELLKKI